jgi:thymidylate kinase
MKILIIEGIPTSGKSSIIKKISELVGEGRVKIYGETETHIPIMDKPDGLHIDFFKYLLKDAVESGRDFVIFDRFHFTQAIRAKVSVDEYTEIEDLLAKQNTLVVYLQVDESAIADRIRLTAERRDKDPAEHFQWGEYFKIKGKTFGEVAEHYAKSPNEKPSQTVRLVNKLGEFVAKEYELTELTILKEENSPTRGLYRDDGQRLFLGGTGVDTIDLEAVTDLEVCIKAIPRDVKILSGKEAQVMFEKTSNT